MFRVDIGPTGEWGYPKSNDQPHLFEKYSSDIFYLVPAHNLDLVLIDGRFRVACTLKSIMVCHANPGFRILIHDFWNRKHYHILLNYLDTVEQVESIGLFTIKPEIDWQALRSDYEKFKFDSR